VPTRVVQFSLFSFLPKRPPLLARFFPRTSFLPSVPEFNLFSLQSRSPQCARAPSPFSGVPYLFSRFPTPRPTNSLCLHHSSFFPICLRASFLSQPPFFLNRTLLPPSMKLTFSWLLSPALWSPSSLKLPGDRCGSAPRVVLLSIT